MVDMATRQDQDAAAVYGPKHFRRRIEDRYNSHIYIAKGTGKRKDIVCLKDMASYIISDRWYNNRLQNTDEESRRIIESAAILIREEIRGMDYSKEHYPSTDDIKNSSAIDSIPPGLKYFLEHFIHDDLKLSAIGQAILQTTRPRSYISPILFGLGIEMHQTFGSEWLLKELSALGFSISMDEVSLFRQSVILGDSSLSVAIPNFPTLTQFSGDNADCNIRTLTGAGTFHGMATLSWHDPVMDTDSSVRIKRHARISVNELTANLGIQVKSCPHNLAFSSPKLKPVLELTVPAHLPNSLPLSNTLWRVTGFDASENVSCGKPQWCNWTGFMRTLHKEQTDVKVDSVHILPILDMNPNDETTIYSTLCFMDNEVKRAGLPSTTVTFDYPLFIKAFKIANVHGLSRLVIRLGGFHLLMSAVGALFSTMDGSGIEDAIQQVYGPNTVPQIMSGKAINRAQRSLHLLDVALHQKLIEHLISEKGLDRVELDDMAKLLNECNPMEVIENCASLHEFDQKVKNMKAQLSERSRTSRLWIQFLDYVETIYYFIASERLGLWEVHLSACYRLLNLFAATGRVHYAKGTRLYLQSMLDLPEEHPWLYEHFKAGSFAVHRTAHAFNGLWSDLAIEQVVMANLKKSQGGLTHGRGLSESVRHQWVYSMHMCASVRDAMNTLTGRKRTTSVQHTELGASRIATDNSDLEKLVSWFSDHDPFSDAAELRSLSTGIVAQDCDNLDCDQCESVGSTIQRAMDNMDYDAAKVPRKKRVRTLKDLESGVIVAGKTIAISPLVLFSRSCSIASRLEEPIETFLEFEMCPHPPALFSEGQMMRKPNKAELSRFLLSTITPLEKADTTLGSVIVIDGGWLLHRVRWERNLTFSDIISSYVVYVSKHFGLSTIVFDGYETTSTKDHEQQRRMAGKMSATIEVTGNRRCAYDQESFLSNKMNKQRFINVLSQALTENHHVVKHANGDADTMIVRVAVSLANNGQAVTVVSEDCDVIVMLLYHCQKPNLSQLLLCKPDKKSVNIIYRTSDFKSPYWPHLLVAHAWTGCDTTSAIFSHGKLALIRQLQKPATRQYASKLAFDIELAKSASDVGKAGEDIFVLMYGGEKGEGLQKLRARRFAEKKDELISLDPSRLPPTSRSAWFHSLRVFLQVQRWKMLQEDLLQPTDWGWTLQNGKLVPIGNDGPIAHPLVLKAIRCKCTSPRNQCGTNNCTCRKNGLTCMEACGGCHGVSCCNTAPISTQLED